MGGVTFFSSFAPAPSFSWSSRSRCRSTMRSATRSSFVRFSASSRCVPLHCFEAFDGNLQPSTAKCSFPISPSSEAYSSTSRNRSTISRCSSC